jgi:hypothetical protein
VRAPRPQDKASRRRARARRALRAPWPSGATRRLRGRTALPIAPWILADCTCTRLVARLRRRSGRSDHVRERRTASARSRSRTTTSYGGRSETAELARDHELIVIPGEEIKTDGQGEVIGSLPARGDSARLSSRDTVAAIKAQGGLVYLPHPFDRMHSIAEPATLQRHLADIDVFEVYNARLLFEAYNDEALRFARKYNLHMGAGSDAHVLQGVGTGAPADAGVRRAGGVPAQPPFGPGSAPSDVARLPPVLKWMAQAKERVR